MGTPWLRTTLKGTMKLSALISMIFDGDSLLEDGLRSNQMSSVLDAFTVVSNAFMYSEFEFHDDS